MVGGLYVEKAQRCVQLRTLRERTAKVRNIGPQSHLIFAIVFTPVQFETWQFYTKSAQICDKIALQQNSVNHYRRAKIVQKQDFTQFIK